MTKEQFLNLKVNDIVWHMSNTGSVGIFAYQYLGVFPITDISCLDSRRIDIKDKHVFVNGVVSNGFSVNKGDEGKAWVLKDIFLTEDEAKEYQKLKRKEEREESE